MGGKSESTRGGREAILSRSRNPELAGKSPHTESVCGAPMRTFAKQHQGETSARPRLVTEDFGQSTHIPNHLYEKKLALLLRVAITRKSMWGTYAK